MGRRHSVWDHRTRKTDRKRADARQDGHGVGGNAIAQHIAVATKVDEILIIY
jgi:hypothetical protein